MSDPVQLDMSTAQPLPTAVTLDMNTAVPLNGAPPSPSLDLKNASTIPNARIRNLPNPAAGETSAAGALYHGAKMGATLASIPMSTAMSVPGLIGSLVGGVVGSKGGQYVAKQAGAGPMGQEISGDVGGAIGGLYGAGGLGKGISGFMDQVRGINRGAVYPGAPLPADPGTFPGANLPATPPADLLRAKVIQMGGKIPPPNQSAGLGQIPVQPTYPGAPLPEHPGTFPGAPLPEHPGVFPGAPLPADPGTFPGAPLPENVPDLLKANALRTGGRPITSPSDALAQLKAGASVKIPGGAANTEIPVQGKPVQPPFPGPKNYEVTRGADPFTHPNAPSKWQFDQDYSSNVKQYGYHPDSQTISVMYKRGGVYQFKATPQQYNQMLKAPSAGGYLHDVIEPSQTRGAGTHIGTVTSGGQK